MKIVYFGYNSFLQHKRGVENVIDFQSKACNFDAVYYFHWGTTTTAYKKDKFVCISIKHCWYWPILLNLIVSRIKNNNKCIIHSHNTLFSVVSISKTDIFTVHDGLYYLNKSKKQKLIFLFRIIELILYYRTSNVHFISNYAKEQSLFGKRKNYVIIPNTSHFEEYKYKVKVKQCTNDSKRILIVRSIEERARFDLLLQVAKQLNSKNYVFTVAGKGPLLQYYQNEIVELKFTNIEMLGYVNDNDLLNLYSECDLVLMIAEYGEGFGLPIIEGYLFNKPVIASNRCAIPEIIFSKNYLFENTINSIVKSIEYVFSIQKEHYANYYENNFSNSMVLSKFRDLYLNTYL
jgi:glycosyltransferase involved in cell wall biosynthesis